MVVPLSLDKVLSLRYRRDLQLEWNYNEAHHGRGPIDGIGRTYKKCDI